MAAFLDKFKFGRKPPTGAGAKKAPAKKAASKAPLSGAGVAAPAGDRDTGIATSVLRHPHVTEKAARMSGQRQYVFVVPLKATKLQVRDAVNKLYGVRPIRVNMLRVKGKHVRFGQTSGVQKDWKKAVVTLAPGAALSIYEGV
ncbi:50S ribosomal protein L23 [Patescibacteria group bacterium]|nr:MAG: 50S ribosomal protein L23 [Patescibacteria group bacterium]